MTVLWKKEGRFEDQEVHEVQEEASVDKVRHWLDNDPRCLKGWFQNYFGQGHDEERQRKSG